MKKYVLRSLGWIFDDDWYNFDDVQDLEGVYNSQEEATERKQYLDFIFFLNFFPYLGRYQIKFWEYSSYQKPEFVDVKKARTLLAKKLNLSKEKLFDSDDYYQDIRVEKKHLLKNIPLQDISEIMKSIKLEFFKIVEFDSEEIFFYHFKRNRILDCWEVMNMHGIHENELYFYDGRDRNPMAKRAVSTIKEAYEFALRFDGYSSIESELIQHPAIQGDFSELSQMPKVLESIIQNSKSISYDLDSKTVKFTKPIAIDELMALDSVLKNPVLIVEKVGIEALEKVDVTWLKNNVKKEYGL